jgi:hypothetical protein
LRNQFLGNNQWKLLTIPVFYFSSDDLNNLRFIGFDRVKSGKDDIINQKDDFKWN